MTMLKRKLGSTGLSVSSIGMGCMPLSNSPSRPSEQDAIKTIQAALAEGINLFDLLTHTASMPMRKGITSGCWPKR